MIELIKISTIGYISYKAFNVFGKKDGVCFRHELAKHIRQYAKLYELDIKKINLKVKR